MRILRLHRTELDYSDLWGSPDGAHWVKLSAQNATVHLEKESIIETKLCSDLISV